MLIGPGMVVSGSFHSLFMPTITDSSTRVSQWGWLVSALFVWAIFPKIEFLSALAIAACLTPTDPILAQAVVGGKFADKHVPAHIRHLLQAESGSNDGAAFPFLCAYTLCSA